MLEHPLTPPIEQSAEFFGDASNGGILTPPSAAFTPENAFPTPQSDFRMGLDNLDERSDMDTRPDGNRIEDEDQDMSDGGAAVAMSFSHADELNSEMDMVDGEAMGREDLVGLFLETQPPMQTQEHFQYESDFPTPQPYSESTPENDLDQDQDEDVSEALLIPTPQQAALPQVALPFLGTATMSGLAQQLQEIQDVQEHIEDVDLGDDIHIAPNANMEDQLNFTLADFLDDWGHSASHGEESRRRKGPSLVAIERQRFEKPEPCLRSDLQGERCDMQRINWMDLGVSRQEARQRRRQTYKNYTNMRFDKWNQTINPVLSDDQNFFRFRRMDFDQNIQLSHFQLRNLMGCSTRDHVFYACKNKILQCNPRYGAKPTVAMDLTDPVVQPAFTTGFDGKVLISTMTVAHDILVAGGFCGEYGLVNLRAHKDTRHTEGLITDDQNSITNHAQIHLSRHSGLPLAVFASNDKGIRILDVTTNKFIAEHKYQDPINCSAISPDRRLRVLVGDSKQVMICNSDTGEILQSLEGHRDFGFACDWADDGWTVATGNQDMQIKIWDARKWTTSQGIACPVATIAAEMAGVRKLKFSPLGSGKRVLVAAEPADIISIIDAESFTSKQTIRCFGEFGGVDFTNDGQDLIVANCDTMRGGLMEFERCNHASGSLYDLDDHREIKPRHRRRRAGHDWMATDEKVVSHPKARGTIEQRRRKAASLGMTMGYF